MYIAVHRELGLKFRPEPEPLDGLSRALWEKERLLRVSTSPEGLMQTRNRFDYSRGVREVNNPRGNRRSEVQGE